MNTFNYISNSPNIHIFCSYFLRASFTELLDGLQFNGGTSKWHSKRYWAFRQKDSHLQEYVSHCGLNTKIYFTLLKNICLHLFTLCTVTSWYLNGRTVDILGSSAIDFRSSADCTKDSWTSAGRGLLSKADCKVESWSSAGCTVNFGSSADCTKDSWTSARSGILSKADSREVSWPSAELIVDSWSSADCAEGSGP
jgi:hypothetical protein